MTLFNTRGIVLKITAHGESDKLVTFFSNDLGRVTGIAKGAQRSRRRFVNKLEEFSWLHLFYRPPRGASGLVLISEADLLCAHLTIRTDYHRYVCAMFISELTLRFTRDNDPDPRLAILLRWAFASLDQGILPQKVAVLYQLKLLSIIGYRPELNRCGNCQQLVTASHSFIFLPGNGALLCNACRNRQNIPNKDRLSLQTLKCLAKAQVASIEQLNRLRLSPSTITEALESLYQYSFHLLQHDIHSWHVMRTLHGPISQANRSGDCP